MTVTLNGKAIELDESFFLEMPTAGKIEIPSIYSLLDDLKSTRGPNKGQFRKSKPKNASGLSRYLWRMIRFHGGIDLSMPIMAGFDLQMWVESQGFKSGIDSADPMNVNVSSIYDRNGNGKTLVDNLDALVDGLTIMLGMNPFKAAVAWGRIL